MFQLKNTIVSEDILDEQFACNLSLCKGQCCIEGEAGAPVEDAEREILDAIFPLIKDLLTPEGVKAIEEQGTYTTNIRGEHETTLIDGEACAYSIIDEQGIAGCGIEKAYIEKRIDFRKPISCHLYPIRVTEYKTLTAVNYHVWDICSTACTLGKERKIPVFRFAREALIRKFGQKWYDELDKMAREYYSEKIKNRNGRH